MARTEAERRQRHLESHGASKGSRSQAHNPFASLFGSGTAPNPKRHRPSGDHDRDRDRERGRDRDWDRSRSKDQGQDQGQRHDRKHRRKHDDGNKKEEDKKGTKHRHHHKHRHHSRERLLVEVDLRCLDARYLSTKFFVKNGFPVPRLESYIRRRYEEQDKPIGPNTHFVFYSEGKLLGPQEQITERTTIWYCMSKNPGELEAWKFTHWQDETNGRLDTALSSELVKAIDEGATVGQLRKKIADYMGIEDAYRVVLTARGGMRPGLLQGDCWEVRQIKSHWLCRWLSIDINPEKCYVVLKGLGREYVYHPTAAMFEKGMELREMQSYIRHRVFRSVCMYGKKSKFDLHWMDVSLSHNDKCPGSFSPIVWGGTYTFEIPVDAAEAFADEENWLLPLTDSCAICMEDKRVTEIPIKITPGCKHKPALCKDCLQQWLQSSLERTSWDRLKCPDCPETLQYAEMKRYANQATFSRYDVLATRSAAEALPNFRWCLSPTCESGQIDDEDCPKFKCQACNSKHCIKHNVPWHKGETCEEYDRRNKQRKKDDKASEQMIKKTSKKCPQCKKDVHKFTGCNHMTCVCGHEWCYICFAPFQRNEHGFLFCRHTNTCTERDPFIDLVAPEFANRAPNAGRPPGAARPAMGRFGGMPEFAPPHLRRQNANAGVGGRVGAGVPRAGVAPRVRPPPGFPFPDFLDLNDENPGAGGAGAQRGGLNEEVLMRAAAMATHAHRIVRDAQAAQAARQGRNQDPAENLPRFGDLRI